jgi:hypothetical protein
MLFSPNKTGPVQPGLFSEITIILVRQPGCHSLSKYSNGRPIVLRHRFSPALPLANTFQGTYLAGKSYPRFKIMTIGSLACFDQIYHLLLLDLQAARALTFQIKYPAHFRVLYHLSGSLRYREFSFPPERLSVLDQLASRRLRSVHETGPSYLSLSKTKSADSRQP